MRGIESKARAARLTLRATPLRLTGDDLRALAQVDPNAVGRAFALYQLHLRSAVVDRRPLDELFPPRVGRR
ncbi:MAG: hypothetical protein QM736_29860 [Vicinamibacterales bacterium]